MWGKVAAGPLAACAALALCACAALPWPSGKERSSEEVPAGAYYDLRGVVHVHTRVSHDSLGSIGEIVDAAHSAGLSWVAFSEHPYHARFGPPSGVVEGVILIPGWEVSTAGASLLALGVAHLRGLPREPAALVAAIHARGGAAFVGHFERSELADPERYAAAAPDGVEIANLHATALSVPGRLALGELLLPASCGLSALTRPPSENLARWSRLPSARAVVGGVDAHAKFRVLGMLGGTLDRYRDVFRILTTHVLARDRSQRSILEALRAGRSYVAFESLRAVDRFVAVRGEDGFHVRAPSEARLDLVCSGVVRDSALAAESVLRAPADADRCHVEAWLGSRLWVVTSQLD
jgi:hypothetical protein